MEALYYNDFENSYISHILKEIYIDKIYDPYVKYMEDQVVVDIGANIGLITNYCRKHARKVVSVEPAKEHFEVLLENIKHNNWDNVSPLNYALGGDNKKIDFYHCVNKTMFTSNEAAKNDDKEVVDCITVDKLFEIAELDEVGFMKIDIEGTEFEMLNHPSFAKLAPKIKSLMIEFHSWTNTHPHQLVAILLDNGFKVAPVKTDAVVYGAYR